MIFTMRPFDLGEPRQAEGCGDLEECGMKKEAV